MKARFHTRLALNPKTRWLIPVYTGDGKEDHTWRWLGIRIKANSQPGDTLFMYWRRRLRQILSRQKGKEAR